MSGSSASEVVLALRVADQVAFLRSLTQAGDAVTELADRVTSANDQIVASNQEVQQSYAEIATRSTETTSLVDEDTTTTTDAMDRLTETVQQLADEWQSASDEMVASMDRLGSSVDAQTAAIDANLTEIGVTAETTAAKTQAASSGVLGLLSSIRTLALAGSVYVAVRSFSQYQQNLALLTTQAGLAAKQLGAVKVAIDQISSSTYMNKNTLAQGFFNPISEGFTTGQATTIEGYASKLSQISGAPLAGTQGTSYAISTMLQTFGMRPTNANVAKVTGLLNAGVGAGDLHLQDLLGAASTGYFNVSQAYGLRPQDAMGALDFFTSQGVPAENAATRMRYFLSLLASPSSTAQSYGMALGLTQSTVTSTESELAALGLRTTKMGALLRTPDGLAKAMGLVQHSIGNMPATEQVGVMSKLFGGGKSDATALALAQHVGLLTQFTNRVGAMSTPQRFDKAWTTWESTFHAQEQKFVTDISSMAIAIGQTWAPAVGALMDVLGPVAHFFAQNTLAAHAFAGVLGGALVLMLVHLTTVVGEQLVRAAADGWESLNSLLDSIVGVAAGGTRAAPELMGLAGAETTEGVTAQTAAATIGTSDAEIVAGDAEMLARVGPLATTLGATALAAGGATAALVLLYQELGNHPRLPMLNQGQSNTVDNALHWFMGSHLPGNQQVNKALGSVAHTLGFAMGGLVTNQPTVLVGEGGPHPEYVIPTDPVHRSRAMALYGSLGHVLGATSGIGESMQLLTALSTVMGGSSGSGGFAGLGSAAQMAAKRAWMATLASGNGAAAMALGMGGAAPSGGALGAATSIAGGGSPQQFAFALLRGLGDTPTQSDIASIMAWEGREGGNWHNSAYYNPLNTTLGLPGSHVMGGGNSAGVQAYGSWGQGVAATIATLKGGGYGDILSALASGKGLNGPLAGLARWSGGGYSSLPVARYDTGGWLPEGASIAMNGTGAPEPVGGAGGRDINITNVVQLDGKQIWRSTKRQIQTEMARR